MSRWTICTAALVASLAAQASAGDKVLIAPVPAWVRIEPTTADPVALAAKANSLPTIDEQVQVDGDKVTAYIDTTMTISSPEILNQRGTLSVPWQPSHGDLTFHRIDIIRGGHVIDALRAGSDFTVLRREARLEQLSVDGLLTAVKHIEDLQVGDSLRMTFSISSRDEVLKGNAQDALFLVPSPTKLAFGAARLVWRTEKPLALKAWTPGVSLEPHSLDAKWSEVVIPLPIAKLPEMPKNFPSRFTPLPIVQFSSFPDWKSVASAMAPLYQTKDSIPAGSELAAKIDAIAARSNDPLVRMADALQMVQDEVRYQLIALGTGNYVPQSPTDTWSKRYGDCKAKTLLLLAILDRLGIEAEPVLANIKRGDSVVENVPSAMAFDHVFVRAKVGGEAYWLDGTMLGSRFADIHDVPRYGYVLPIYSTNEGLVNLPRRANARPDVDVSVDYDLAAGPHLPAPFKLVVRYAGMSAAKNRVQPNADYDDQLNRFAQNTAKNWTGSDIIGKPEASFDPARAEWTISVDGVVSLDWQYLDGHYDLSLRPALNVVYDAARDRAAWRQIPALVSDPWTAHARSSFELPDGGKAVTVGGELSRRVSLPVVDWQRTATYSGGKLVDEITSRESGMEVQPESVSSTGKTISEAMASNVHVDLAADYPQRWIDVPARAASTAVKRMKDLYDQRIAAKPDDPARLADRAWFREALFDWAGAEADLGKAIAMDSSAERYLARSRLRTRKGDHAGALLDAKTAYGLDDGSNDVRDQLAQELADAGKADEALELLPANPDANTEAGLTDVLFRVDILERSDRHGEAMEILNGLLQKRGRSAQLHNARCWYRALRNDDLDDALNDCNQAIQLSSDPTVYLDSRGMVNFRAGKFEEARADYEAALAGAPDIPSALFMSGIIALKLGQKEKAAAAIAAARKVYPEIDHFYQIYGIKP